MVAYVGLYQIANMQQSNNSLFEAGLAVALVVLATLATALGQPQQCDFTSGKAALLLSVGILCYLTALFLLCRVSATRW